jgi:mRNA-degrading endonuclease RelE of RelBE toxin-antitoxin system
LNDTKIFHAAIQYRAVYDMAKDKKEVLVIFIGSRENFYKELRRFLA